MLVVIGGHTAVGSRRRCAGARVDQVSAMSLRRAGALGGQAWSKGGELL
jgi:hypothetical protein